MSASFSVPASQSSPFQFFADFMWACRELNSSRKDASWKRALRFSFHTLLHPIISATWLRFLRKNILLTTSIQEATFIDRIHRPFFDKRCNTHQRSHFLRSHFNNLSVFLTSAHLHLVITGTGINLATLKGKGGEIIEVSLVRLPNYDKEGGSTITVKMNGTVALMLTFTIVSQNHNLVLKIGGVQTKEYLGVDSRSFIREVTHALYGIQPRLLLIESLRNLAMQLGSETIEGISERNHIYQALRYFNKRTIHAQYNELWTLVGATKMDNGNFSLPLRAVEKSIESRPSKKRNEYRNRAVLFDALRTQISAYSK